MNRNLLDNFGDSETRVVRALESLYRGNGVLVVDDENRENEGDIIFGARNLTTEQMALMICETSGIVCLCLPREKTESLALPMMTERNTSAHGTAFTVSVDAAEGVTTGVSATDRVTTVRAATADDARPEDLNRPGHIFPLVAKPGGVLERRGHTECVVDLMRLSGLSPYGILGEVTNPDGTMARLPELVPFARRHALPLLSVEDVCEYRKKYRA